MAIVERPQQPDLAAIKEKQQQAWSSGDFSVVAGRIVSVAERLVDAADLHAGVWRPTTITAAKYFIGWDRSSAFLTHDGDPIPKGDGNPSPILRCTGPDTCSPIGLSAGNPLFFVVTDNLG